MVQKGESLLKISMMYKVRSQELAHVNNIFGETLFPNQVSREVYQSLSHLQSGAQSSENPQC